MVTEAKTQVGACRRAGKCLLLAGAVFLILGPTVVHGDVKWRSGPADIAGQKRVGLDGVLTQLSSRAEARHIVVQFDKPIGPAEREELSKAGLNLLGYVGDNAFFASFSAEGVDVPGLSAMPFLAGVQGIQREWKQALGIVTQDVPPWAIVEEGKFGELTVGLYILFHPDVPLSTDAVSIASRHGAIVRDTLSAVNGLVIEMPLDGVDALAEEDAIQWMEWPLPRMSEVNDSNRVRTQANIVQAAPYGLSGSGVTVLVYDAGTARSSHVDFQGRLTVHDASGMIDHATHVSGTIGGAGVANAAYKGMAPAVTLLSYGFQYDGSGIFLYTNPGDLAADYGQAINTYGADIANSSIGTNTETNGFDCAIQGDYGVTDQLIDTIVRGDGSNPQFTQPFRVVWANGNERQGSRCDVEGYGDYYSTAPPATAKNHIAVGALNSNDDSMTYFSSWGPVDDGRMKPDISGPGCQSDGDAGVTSCSSGGDTSYTTMCGTSMASPTVCGLSSLLLQDYRAQFPSKPDFRNSTLKILLAHTAVDLGNVGPDYQYGYGSVRIQNAVDFMRTGNFLENQVGQGQIYSVLVLVQAGDPELKVTLAYDDYPGTPNVNPALVNDLDLRVFSPSSQQYYPWTLDRLNPSVAAVRTQANHVDNIEQVYVASPAVGVWRIEVYGYNVPQAPQPFSLCASPELVACSSQGTIALDAAKYLCSDTAAIQVIDCDLNTNNNVIETVTVTVTSTSEPAGESVLLTETAAATADFRGSIPLSTTNSSGVLLVAHGNTVTARYIDADDGQGHQNVTVTDTATVDCVAPVISSVATTNIGPFSATVTFNTDEAANGTVRYGLSCGSLTGSASEVGYKTAHSVNLTGLQESTPYYYAVDAVDEGGNAGTNNNGGVCFTFTTTDVPNYFTELFASDNDLDNRSLYFIPDASFDYYRGCTETISALPVNPSGGTTLTLTDDSYATISLTGGKTVSLYGTSYGTFYVGSNGYVTFNTGDSTYSESLAGHFNRPRISAMFDDLNPGTGGTVSWKQLADRAVVTWLNVYEYGTTNPNTAQIEMRFDGTIVISYLTVSITDGLAGLSEGLGQPSDFYETDLTAMGSCAAPTCSDGIQNQGEERIDCGGPCPPCDCLSDAECSDGLFCTGAETCDAYGNCQAGSDPCPGQYCNEGTDSCYDCQSSPECDDGLYCNGVETCVGGFCQAGTAVNCSDGVACTNDSCNEGTDSCDHVPSNALCNDGLFCNGAETCHLTLGCQDGTDPCAPGQCDEANDRCVGEVQVWMSFTSNTTVPGVGTVADEDIVSYDPVSGLWAMIFDGSDVGLGGFTIDGMAVMANGDILLSFTAAGSVPGLVGGPSGTTVDDSDIVRFTPTSLGPTTAGTFTFYFDASDVGLTTNDEDVDAIALTSDGRLVLSTLGAFSVTGLSGQDKDLIVFNATSLGSVTAGTFAMYFDGSDVSLTTTAEDVDAASVTLDGTILLSTTGNFSVPGVSGANEDIFEFFPTSLGPTTSGTYSMYLDVSTLGIATGADVGSVELIE